MAGITLEFALNWLRSGEVQTILSCSDISARAFVADFLRGAGRRRIPKCSLGSRVNVKLARFVVRPEGGAADDRIGLRSQGSRTDRAITKHVEPFYRHWHIRDSPAAGHR